MLALNPEILTWARETSGLTVQEAAVAVGLGAAHGRTGEERLAALEAGEETPSRPLLVRMAKAYRRPLVVFYLPAPPAKGDRGQDFRKVPGVAAPAFDAELDALVRDIQARQSIVKSVQEDLEALPVEFVDSVTMEVKPADLAVRMAGAIRFDLAEFRREKAPFAYLRQKVENAGVFVLLLGNLGSFHTNISPERFRGFAVADPLAPFVVVNDQDAEVAWAFTLLHELTHLWLGTTGVSGEAASTRIERYCNDVAAEVLLPGRELAELRRLPVVDATNVTEFAQARRVSRAMVAYRAFRAGILTEARWEAMSSQFRREWQEHKAARTARQRKEEAGPSYYVVRRHRLGASLLGLVRNSLQAGALTYTAAGRVLGVKARNVEPLLRGSAGRV